MHRWIGKSDHSAIMPFPRRRTIDDGQFRLLQATLGEIIE
jgi:hypothetical protein